ncbi:PBP1A family penicillin-binding protein [Candidatus Woesebacteria bacterium]|nr:PBP1A family penicillin-binding protein [Candidatus Woesebacteria bacterium]
MAKWKRRYRRKKRGNWIKKLLPAVGEDKTKYIARIAKYLFIALVLGFLGLLVALPIIAYSLPAPEKVIRQEGFSSKILDRNGEVLYDIFQDARRTPVDLKDVPEYLKQATISIEDKNFYEHQGIDPLGIIRGLSRIFTRGYAQGGSTLTQQLVKNVLLSSERTITRKIKEFVITIQIENKFEKDEILEMYLNEMPYGGTAYGVQSASEIYFGKDVKDLNLVESAILAGLPQRPSVYSPFSSTPDSYIGRSEQVLRRMREDGYIDKEQEQNAKEMLSDVEFQSPGSLFKAPHFVQYVQKILEDRYGESVLEQGGLEVTTTLDLELQEEAQKIVTEEIADVRSFDIGNGAAVVIDPETGEILAMVGSKDFSDPDYDGQVNVTLSLRQPGSAFKPITYVTGLKEGYTASTLFADVPTEFPSGEGQDPYKPDNYDGKFRGPVQMRYALANSINVPAVKMLALVGVADTLETAYDLGLSSLEPSRDTLSRVGLSLTLGGGEVRLLELTGAYAAFMNGGYRIDPISILKIEDLNGDIIEENTPKKKNQVLSEEEAFIIADILSDNDARSAVFGTNSLLNIPGRQVAVKTGTTNDKRDNWTIGGNKHAVVGVWVGNNDNSQMKEVASGVSGASPIWRRIMIEVLNGKSVVNFEPPDGIVTAAVDTISGYAAHDGYPSRIEYFIRGTEPGEDPVHKKLKVCKSDGNLATPSDVASGNYEEKEFVVLTADDPFAAEGEENKWQKGIDEWINSQTDEKYKAPRDYCSSSNPVNVDFDSPRDHDSNLGNNVNIKIRPESVNDITEVKLYVNDERVKTFDNPPYEYQVNLNKGTHKMKAVARDSRDNQSEREITIGVEQAWDYVPPTPTPTPKPTATNTPIPSPTPTETEE